MAQGCRRSLAVVVLAVVVGCGYVTDDRGMTALMRAAAAGDAAEVAALMARGHPVDAQVRAGVIYQARVLLALLSFFGEGPPTRDPGHTALMYAAENGHVVVVEKLLAGGADPNVHNYLGMHALHIALTRPQPVPRLAQALVAAGSDVNAYGGYSYRRWTPLMYAAQQGDAQSVRLLLDAGAAKDAADKEGWTALMLAARSGHVDVVPVLLAAGADREMRDQTAHWTALEWANEHRHAAIVDMLRTGGASTAGLTDQALLQAVSLRNVEETRQALAGGARVEARTAQGESVLFVAARSGVPEIVSMLLSAGADVHFRHRVYGSPLTEASSNGHDEIVRRLLAAGADPNAGGEAALARAALGRRAGIVDQLLVAGADPNAGRGGVLREACRGDDVQIVERLLSAGADPNLHTDTSTTALIQASLQGNVDMVRRLLAAGARPNIVDHVDYTALWSAAALGHDEVVRLLLAAGADRSHRKDGATPEQVARRSGHAAVAERIREAGGQS